MSEGYAPELAGDWKDDDAQVIDDLVAQSPNPTEGELDTVVVNKEQFVKRPTPTQNVSGTFVFDANSTGSIIRALPYQPTRRMLYIAVIGATSTEYVSLADDQGKLNSSAALRIYPSRDLTDTESTGPIWMSAITASTLTVTWWAVLGGEDD
jgi:hypothetical protein